MPPGGTNAAGSGVGVDWHRLAHGIPIDAHLHQCLHCNAVALAHNAEQQVLGGDIVLAELQCFAQGTFQHALGARRERDVASGGGHILVCDALDLLDGFFVTHVQTAQCLGGNAFAFADKAKQQVLGANVGLLQRACLFLCEHEHTAGFVGEFLEHVYPPPSNYYG